MTPLMDVNFSRETFCFYSDKMLKLHTFSEGLLCSASAWSMGVKKYQLSNFQEKSAYGPFGED